MPTEFPRVETYDYSLFGEVEIKPLGRSRQVISKRQVASGVTGPRVAQFDEAHLTALAALRHPPPPQPEPCARELPSLPLPLHARAPGVGADPVPRTSRLLSRLTL